ncbi:MAG: RloB domain-containing protein [Burkholderiales bacterium]|nr:RloB domain-containing protein [Burkholderiales bacterium]
MANFNRKPAKFKPQPKVLVICEDSKSAKHYLEDAAIYFRAQLEVKIIHCGKTDPLGIAKEALREQKNYDQIFCVIDRDTHETFSAAQQAVQKAEKVRLITSYPCYEFWLLLHFGYSCKPYIASGKKSAAELVAADLRKKPEMQDYDKAERLFALLTSNLPQARKHATRILQDAHKTGEFNPSTALHELLSHFETLGQPQPI